ncbi:hypothetical protein AK88_02083 [Plasmodium fragile]|uniref:Tryptophan/threonine-rich plasmodium antigen C-terminal domain-containing protein n=1 Tax=Plasmodium fragile TaxID=5857 RepID=A0A0D9QND1_PLAFR|nr:uncharacterized protein AK88_02083 [Plasmodium fragile]KJP88302.1 hypothetical protein AK88_02083 [Plasmodium fragile]
MAKNNSKKVFKQKINAISYKIYFTLTIITKNRNNGEDIQKKEPSVEGNEQVATGDKDAIGLSDAIQVGNINITNEGIPPCSGECPNSEFQDLVNEVIPPPAQAPLPLQTETPTGHKLTHWNQWMQQAKSDFSGYQGKMNTHRHEWTKEKEDELQKFCKYLEKRWMSYTGNIDRACKSNFLQTAKRWNTKQWDKWMKSEGKHHMNKQFQKWLDYNKYKLQDWNKSEWSKWKTHVKDKLDEHIWKTREVSGRAKEWIKYTDKMEKKFSKENKKHCKNWEKKANSSFKKWEGDFTKKWISNKQWNSWCKELEDQI